MSETKEKTPDVGALLADLRAKRAKLDAAIAAIEEYAGTAPSGSVTLPAINVAIRGSSGDGQTIAPDAFFSMSVVDAAVKYLDIVKKPQSLKDVTTALEKGGLIHQSKKFETTVYAMLSRAEKRGDRVRRFHKNWALASWYPNRPTNKAKPAAKRTKKRAKAAQAKPKLAIPAAVEAKAAGANPAP